MWRLMLLFLVAMGGFWYGKNSSISVVKRENQEIALVYPEKRFPISEHKSFVVVVYAYNQALWCEKNLRSIFEQEYDHYRVIFIDDGSVDGTAEKAKQFIVDNNQEQKVILLRNVEKIGLAASLYKAVDSCLDREVILPLQGKDWLSTPFVLNQLNSAYQNPDVWTLFGKAISYPAYEMQGDLQACFYAALFKQIHLQDLYKNDHFAVSAESYLDPIVALSGGRVLHLNEHIAFCNASIPTPVAEPALEKVHYQPLATFPSARSPTSADILVFSFDRPLQLYACLESVQRYMTGFDHLSVLYRASSAPFEQGYETVKSAFPFVRFIKQSSDDPKHDFKPHVENIVFGSKSQYVLFGVDDIIVKDFVDLALCMDLMEKTGAYGFYLRLGQHITHCYQFDRSQSVPPSLLLTAGVYAWDIAAGEYDWGFPNSLDMTLFKKDSLKKAFSQSKYKTPNSLEFVWAKDFAPEKALGLYFERSKLVNIPMNIVGKTGNPHMNYLDVEALLTKFNQGLKIDIEPLYKVENTSPHIDYIPEFVLR